MLDTWWPTGDPADAVTQSLRCYSPDDLEYLRDGIGLVDVQPVPWILAVHRTRVRQSSQVSQVNRSMLHAPAGGLPVRELHVGPGIGHNAGAANRPVTPVDEGGWRIRRPGQLQPVTQSSEEIVHQCCP